MKRSTFLSASTARRIIRSAFYGVGRSANPSAGLFEGYNFANLHKFA